MIELSAVQSSAQTFISGGSRISPRRGPQLRRGAPTYDFAKFSQKLHEIERIWAPEGGGVPRAPLRSATVYSQCYFVHWHLRMLDTISRDAIFVDNC